MIYLNTAMLFSVNDKPNSEHTGFGNHAVGTKGNAHDIYLRNYVRNHSVVCFADLDDCKNKVLIPAAKAAEYENPKSMASSMATCGLNEGWIKEADSI